MVLTKHFKESGSKTLCMRQRSTHLFFLYVKRRRTTSTGGRHSSRPATECVCFGPGWSHTALSSPWEYLIIQVSGFLVTARKNNPDEGLKLFLKTLQCVYLSQMLLSCVYYLFVFNCFLFCTALI